MNHFGALGHLFTKHNTSMKQPMDKGCEDDVEYEKCQNEENSKKFAINDPRIPFFNDFHWCTSNRWERKIIEI